MQNLLLRGLKFTPTPKYSNINEMQCDIRNFARSLRLLEFFDHRNFSDESVVRPKSNWIPNPNRDKHLEECISRLYRLADSLVDDAIPDVTPNLPAGELKAFSQLTKLVNDKRLWIVESDKGGIICLFDHAYIKRMGHSILQDTSQFRHVEPDCEKNCLKEIRALCRTHNFLTANESKFILGYESKIANFYVLPKVLKSQAVKENLLNPELVVSMPPPDDLKFRHIIGGPQSRTSHLSQLLDVLLQPFIALIQSNLKDDFAVIRKIDTEWRHMIRQSPDSYRFYTWDIEAFYPSITFSLVHKALKFWIEKHPEKLHARFTLEFILDAVRIILGSNNCVFVSRKDSRQELIARSRLPLS